jgi:hypothetical protein
MTEKLFRLGTTQWWVLVDTDREQIVDQFNKPQLSATITALETTIAAQPNLTQMQQDYADLVNLVKAQNIPKDRKDRVIAMLYAMYDSLSQSQPIREAIERLDRLEDLKKRLAEMV